HVAVMNLAERSSGEGFRRDVADAGACRNAAETGIGQHRNLLAEREMLEGGGDLVNLFHPAAHRASTAEYEYVTWLQLLGPSALYGLNGLGFRRKDLRRSTLAIDAVRIHHARVDRRRFDDATTRRKIAHGEANRRSKAFLRRALRRHDD